MIVFILHKDISLFQHHKCGDFPLILLNNLEFFIPLVGQNKHCGHNTVGNVTAFLFFNIYS